MQPYSLTTPLGRRMVLIAPTNVPMRSGTLSSRSSFQKRKQYPAGRGRGPLGTALSLPGFECTCIPHQHPNEKPRSSSFYVALACGCLLPPSLPHAGNDIHTRSLRVNLFSVGDVAVRANHPAIDRVAATRDHNFLRRSLEGVIMEPASRYQ